MKTIEYKIRESEQEVIEDASEYDSERVGDYLIKKIEEKGDENTDINDVLTEFMTNDVVAKDGKLYITIENETFKVEDADKFSECINNILYTRQYYNVEILVTISPYKQELESVKTEVVSNQGVTHGQDADTDNISEEDLEAESEEEGDEQVAKTKEEPVDFNQVQLTADQIANLEHGFKELQVLSYEGLKWRYGELDKAYGVSSEEKELLEDAIKDEMAKRVIERPDLLDDYTNLVGDIVALERFASFAMSLDLIVQNYNNVKNDVYRQVEEEYHLNKDNIAYKSRDSLYSTCFIKACYNVNPNLGQIFEKLCKSDVNNKYLTAKVYEDLQDINERVIFLANTLGINPERLAEGGVVGSLTDLVNNSNMPDTYRGIANMTVELAPIGLGIWAFFALKKKIGWKGLLVSLGLDIAQSAGTGKSFFFNMVPSILYGGGDANEIIKNIGALGFVQNELKEEGKEVKEKNEDYEKVGRIMFTQLFVGDMPVKDVKKYLKDGPEGIDFNLDQFVVYLKDKQEQNPQDKRAAMLQEYIDGLGSDHIKGMFNKGFAAMKINNVADMDNYIKLAGAGGSEDDSLLDLFRKIQAQEQIDKAKAGVGLGESESQSGSESVAEESDENAMEGPNAPTINEAHLSTYLSDESDGEATSGSNSPSIAEEDIGTKAS